MYNTLQQPYLVFYAFIAKYYNSKVPAFLWHFPYHCIFYKQDCQTELDSEWELVFNGNIAYERGLSSEQEKFTEIELDNSFNYSSTNLSYA